MAWTYRSRRYSSRTVRRSFRRRRMAHPRYRRRYRRHRRSSKSTKSSVVKLTTVVSHRFDSGTDGIPQINPFLFTPLSLSGFGDYYATYSHFRILKAKLHIPRDVGVDDQNVYRDTDSNYLVVGSRPFAATTLPTPQGEPSPLNYVPQQRTDVLRQSRWQKVIYPSSTRTQITVGFYPYTMIGTFGPMWSNSATGAQYQRIWEARRWMPFTWATGGRAQLPFFGPYIAHMDSSTDSSSSFATSVTNTVQITMEVWLQFKGQK